MRVVIIGGSGHVGTFLVPRLVEAGYEVINVSRGKSGPYHSHAAWRQVRQVSIDRQKAEAEGVFGERIKELQPDVVIDMICFTLKSAKQLVQALKGQVQHFLLCGTIWVHGPSVEVPVTEDAPRRPFGEYGIQKAAIEAYLLEQARKEGFPATVLHPGHIVGPGWEPINPAGHRSLWVFEALARGEELLLPNLGMETLHHVHADDVAQAFFKALTHWGGAVGESFHVVSPRAVTLRGYAERVASWFGQEAKLRFLPFEEWKRVAARNEEEIRLTSDHILHSPNCSIAKAQKLIDYQPRYSSFQAVYEALVWLAEHGRIQVPPLR